MINTLTERYLTAIIGIGTGQLGDGPPVYHTITDHRMSFDITAYGGEMQGTANIKIYGIKQELMNALFSMGPVHYQLRGKNTIQLLAGDSPNVMTTVYGGTIMTAYADYNTAPDVPFEITAQSAAVVAMQPATPTSTPYNIPVTVEQIMKTLASKGKLAWGENVGVDTVFKNVTYNGSVLDQIRTCAFAAGIDYQIENFTLSIKSRLKNFSTVVPVISPSTGMVGYPIVSAQFMFVKSLFIPSIKNGCQVQVADSIVTGANGKWTVISLQHELESRMPDGKWFTTIGVRPYVFG